MVVFEDPCSCVSRFGLAPSNFMFCITPCKAMWHSTSLSGPGFHGRLMCSSPNEAFLDILFAKVYMIVPCPFLWEHRRTRGCIHVQLCMLQVPFCSSAVVAVSSPHSWGRVCRHNSQDESGPETDTVKFRAVVALERVVVHVRVQLLGEIPRAYPYGPPPPPLSLPQQLRSLTLQVIIFVFGSYCWHLNSGASQSGLTQTARNHTSQPSAAAARAASNFSQIKGLFYLVFFSLGPCTVRKQTRLLPFDSMVASGCPRHSLLSIPLG